MRERRVRRFRRAACRLGVALPLDARTILGVTRGRAFSGTSGAGRSETESEGSLYDLPNSLVAVGPANALGIMGIAVHVESMLLTVMWWNSRICSWRPLLNLGICIVFIQRIRPSVIHPCVRLLLHVLLMGRVVGCVIWSAVWGLEVCCKDVALHGWMVCCTM